MTAFERAIGGFHRVLHSVCTEWNKQTKLQTECKNPMKQPRNYLVSSSTNRNVAPADGGVGVPGCEPEVPRPGGPKGAPVGDNVGLQPPLTRAVEEGSGAGLGVGSTAGGLKRVK